MSHENILLIIAVATIIQGFLLSIAIFIKSSKSNTANTLLSLFIFLVSFSMLGRIAYILTPFKWDFLFATVMDVIIFSYGPLSYFYLKALLNGKYISWVKYIPHSIPLLIFLGYCIYQFFFKQHFDASIFGQNIDFVYFFLELLAILSNAFYIYIGYKMINVYEKNTPKQLSYLPQIKYIKIFLVVIALIILIWFFGFISKYDVRLQFGTVFTYNMVWILISCLTFAFAYISFFETGIISISEKVIKYEQGYLGDDFYESLRNELDQKINEKEPFLNPKLTLSELAKLMGQSQRDISRVINEHHNVNFYEFINKFRVEKFKQLIESKGNKDFTIISLAYEAGFNSKATFYATFKKNMNCTPSTYIKSIGN